MGVSISMLQLYTKLLNCKYFISKKNYNQSLDAGFEPELTVKISKQSLSSQLVWEILFKQLTEIIILDLALDANSIYAPEYYFIFYKVTTAYRKAMKDYENKHILKRVVETLAS